VKRCGMHIRFGYFSVCILLHPLFTAPLHAQTAIPLDSLLFEAYPLDVEMPNIPARIAEPDTHTGFAILPAEQEAATETTIALYLDSIAATEAGSGPFAPVLLEQYMSLGKAYQQNEQHLEAIEVFEKAEYISRINSGLFTAEQFVIVENLIASYLATGEQRKAMEKQQYLLYLSRQNFGDDSLQAVPVLHKLGDWQMATFSSAINADNVFTISIGSGPSASPRELAFGNLYLAQDSYFHAIYNLVVNNKLDTPALPELEMKLIEAVFLGANREGLLTSPDFYLDRRPLQTGSRVARRQLNGFSASFVNGRNAYDRLRQYEERQPNINHVDIAQAIIGLADWHLLFNRVPTALRMYEEADAYLRTHNVEEQVITEMLTPELPQKLPAFTPLPHSRKKYGIAADAPLEFAGYADVSFNLSRYGNVRNLKITGTTGNFTKNMERRLRRLLQSSPFRPRLQQGKAVTSVVNIRYYYADARTLSPPPPRL
jgi:tetratricopeptide (TPR) repeat protein